MLYHPLFPLVGIAIGVTVALVMLYGMRDSTFPLIVGMAAANVVVLLSATAFLVLLYLLAVGDHAWIICWIAAGAFGYIATAAAVVGTTRFG